ETARDGEHLEAAREARERARGREREEPQSRAGEADRSRGRRSEPGGAQLQAQRRRFDDERDEKRQRDSGHDGCRGAAPRNEGREARGVRERTALGIVAPGVLQRAAHEAAHGGGGDEIQEDRGENLRYATPRLEVRGRQHPERSREGGGDEKARARDERGSGKQGSHRRRGDRASEELPF